MVKETPFFKALWKLTVKICHKAQIPLYRKDNDPKVFTTIQKIYLLLYKAKKKLTLRGLIEDLGSSKVVEYLKLQRIPNFSTLSYFLTTLPMTLLRMINEVIQTMLPDYEAAIIDSTGFECTHPSHYYCQRINTPYPVDGFLSLHMIIDQENGYIRSFKTIATKVHDSTTLIPLVKQLNKRPTVLFADRGYDSEENYAYLIEKMGCLPLILQKNILKPLKKCTGFYRRMIREIFDYGEYLLRNKVEGVIHSVKTRYQGTLSTRNVSNQKKELTIRVILYNLEKNLAAAIALLLLYIKELFNKTVNNL